MSDKKVNPNKRPATQADVKRAERQGREFGTKQCMSMVFMVLRDKEGFTAEDLERFADEMNDLADSMAQKYVKLNDLLNTLRQETGIRLTD